MSQKGQGHDVENTEATDLSSWEFKDFGPTAREQKERKEEKKRNSCMLLFPHFLHCNLVMSSHVIFYLFVIKYNLCSTQLSLTKCACFPWCCISITSDNFLIKRISLWVNLETRRVYTWLCHLLWNAFMHIIYTFIYIKLLHYIITYCILCNILYVNAYKFSIYIYILILIIEYQKLLFFLLNKAGK